MGTAPHGLGANDVLRALPVLTVLAMALWTRRRLSDAVMEPAVLLSLLATSLAIRLVFEGGCMATTSWLAQSRSSWPTL